MTLTPHPRAITVPPGTQDERERTEHPLKALGASLSVFGKYSVPDDGRDFLTALLEALTDSAKSASCEPLESQIGHHFGVIYTCTSSPAQIGSIPTLFSGLWGFGEAVPPWSFCVAPES